MRQNHNHLGRLLLVCMTGGLGACAADAKTDRIDDSEAPFAAIIDGAKTAEMPAIGMFDGGACTATLIGSRVILLAAHCLDFDDTKSFFSSGLSGPPPSFPNYNSGHSFTVQTARGDTNFDIKRFAILAGAYGSRDIAVAELERDVPSSLATPLRVADEYPEDGTSMSVWGYGASSGRYTDEGWKDLKWPDGRVKRRRDSTWNADAFSTDDHVVCPGDSGGPTLNDRQEIVGVHSAAACTGGDGFDTNADAVAAAEFIDRMATIFGNGELCERCPSYALRTGDGEHYLQAVNGGGGDVTAEPTEIGEWETFRMVSLSVGAVAFQAQDGSFLSAVGGGGGALRSNQYRIGYWETFIIPKVPDSLSTLNSPHYYVSAEGGGGGEVNANRKQRGDWERLTWVKR